MPILYDWKWKTGRRWMCDNDFSLGVGSSIFFLFLNAVRSCGRWQVTQKVKPLIQAAAPRNVCRNCRLPWFLKVRSTGISHFTILGCDVPFGDFWLHVFYKHYRCAAPGFFNFHHFSILIEPAAAPRNVCSQPNISAFLRCSAPEYFTKWILRCDAPINLFCCFFSINITGAMHLIHFYPQVRFPFFIESHRKNLIQFLQP